MAGLYDRASLEFSLAGEPAVATRAGIESKRARQEGAEIIASERLGSDGATSARQALLRDFPNGTWVMIRFEGGAEALERMTREASRDSFTAINLVAALIVNPSSRQRGVALAASFPLDSRIAIMQELAHAHDNERPWSGTYAPDLATFGDTPEALLFARTYRVLRPVAWRLWEVPLAPEDTIQTLLSAAKDQDLDAPTTRAILAYYVQNELWLYASREGSAKTFAEIDDALRRHGFGPLLDFSDVKPLPGDGHAIEEALGEQKKRGASARK